MSKGGTVRRLSAEQITQLGGDPTTPLAPDDPGRDAAQQVEAMLRLTDAQIRNLENGVETSGLLSAQDARQMRGLAELLLTLVRAQRDAAKADDFNPAEEAKRRTAKEKDWMP